MDVSKEMPSIFVCSKLVSTNRRANSAAFAHFATCSFVKIVLAVQLVCFGRCSQPLDLLFFG